MPTDRQPFVKRPDVSSRAGDEARADELQGARLHISVIIPAYNAERFLEATVNSVLSQTHGDWDLMIVDNGSSDGTFALATRLAANDGRITVLRLTENAGPSGGRNAGVVGLPTSGEPLDSGLLFLDSDDTLEPSALTLLATRLRAEPGLPGVYGNARYIDQEGGAIRGGQLERLVRDRPIVRDGRVEFDSHSPRTGFESLVVWNCVTTPGMMLIRRSAWDTVGSFDPACKPAEDWDMAIRLARLGPLGFIDEAVLGYRRHETNMSNQRKAMPLARRTIIAKARRDPTNTPQQRAMIEHAFRPAARYNVRAKLQLARSAAKERRWRAMALELQRALAAASAFVLGCP